ncbi:hypothetical protein BS47DRAFT_1365784 [Hydnum rufescens UP504]|uniref:Uncharacterized protein n=1 Tax=Hydnum rufescens UP504 TaxID=1448309 RepID=A0A9P6DRR9_9AGAM|nr:hypothetical protein BS47DRAFT_1365784 [Hydnum rufescens UP504]
MLGLASEHKPHSYLGEAQYHSGYWWEEQSASSLFEGKPADKACDDASTVREVVFSLIPRHLNPTPQHGYVSPRFDLSNESDNDKVLPPPLKRRQGPNLNALSKSASQASVDDEELASQVSMHDYDPTPTHKNVHDLCTGLRHDEMAEINDGKDCLLVCLWRGRHLHFYGQKRHLHVQSSLKDERKQKNQKTTGDKITAWVAMVKSGLM